MDFSEFSPHAPAPPISNNGTLLQPPSMPLIFERIYIRWVTLVSILLLSILECFFGVSCSIMTWRIPDLAKEPTSTLRLITPGNRYIDLSIILPPRCRRTDTVPQSETDQPETPSKKKKRNRGKRRGKGEEVEQELEKKGQEPESVLEYTKGKGKGKGKEPAHQAASTSSYAASESSLSSAYPPTTDEKPMDQIEEQNLPMLVAFSAGTYYRAQTCGLRGHLLDSLTPINRLSHHYHKFRRHANGDVLAYGARDKLIRVPASSVTDSGEQYRHDDNGRRSTLNTEGVVEGGRGIVEQLVKQPYEELWRPHALEPEFSQIAIVLLLRDEYISDGWEWERTYGAMKAKGMVVRVGGWCQGVIQTQDVVVAERWVRTRGAKWERVARVAWRRWEKDNTCDRGVWVGMNEEPDTFGMNGYSMMAGGPSYNMDMEDWGVNTSPGPPSSSSSKGKGNARNPRHSSADHGQPRLPNIQEYPEEFEHDFAEQSYQQVPMDPYTYHDDDPVKKMILPCGVACMDRDQSPEGHVWQGARYCKEASGAGFVVEKTVEVGDVVCAGEWRWEVIERCQWQENVVM